MGQELMVIREKGRLTFEEVIKAGKVAAELDTLRQIPHQVSGTGALNVRTEKGNYLEVKLTPEEQLAMLDILIERREQFLISLNIEHEHDWR